MWADLDRAASVATWSPGGSLDTASAHMRGAGAAPEQSVRHRAALCSGAIALKQARALPMCLVWIDGAEAENFHYSLPRNTIETPETENRIAMPRGGGTWALIWIG